MQIQTGAGSGASRAGGSSESPSLIAQLQARAKGLWKKIQALRKSLAEVTDPVQRLAIMKEILDLQDSLRQVEAQMAELQLRDKRKAQARINEPNDESKSGQDGDGQALDRARGQDENHGRKREKDWDDSDGYRPHYL